MSLVINATDLHNIESALNEDGNAWDNPCLAEFKSKVKAYYREFLEEQCCYCRKNTLGEFKMVLDIEHILPKSKFRLLMFTLYNLSVSCKRCNMNIKREDISFLTDIDAVNNNPEDTNLYRIIHPNFDPYFSHLEYFTQTVNQQKIIKYKIVAESEKGKFTYDYFKLSELEVDSINKAQGLKETEELSEAIDPAIAKRIEELLKNKI